ncbi:MAG TPA: hypothetical protein VIM01_13435 [Dermatophilaceae bacterium]|jgi:hypothetical protein
MASVPNFLPSTNGLAFVNSWPSEPDVVVQVPGYGPVGIGNASNGLCGGMAFAVRDVFEAKLLPITAPQPAPGSPLFKYPVRRLIDSFDVPAGVAKYYAWMNTPDGDVRLWFVVHRGVWWRTAAEEWPKVRADIDAGHPSCLGIVAVRSANPVDLGRNHQVLAYAYEQDGHHVILSLYDPNADLDKADEVRVSFDTGQPSQAGPIVSNIDIADPVRGFFRLPYTPADPSGL